MSSTSQGRIALTGVTMMEAVHRLREHRVYVQFEREPLTAATIDRTRPVVDSKRRFDVSLDLGAPADAVVAALVAADGTYDWVQLTRSPESFFVFPRSTGDDKLAGSTLAAPVSASIPAGQSLAAAVIELGLEPRITLFDRGGFLDRARAGATVKAAGQPAYQMLGELFASSGDDVVWDVTPGLDGGAAIMAISRLPPP